MEQGHWQAGSAVPPSNYNPDPSMEYSQNQSAEMADTPMKPKKPWERLGPDGRPIKRKPNPARRNMMLRKSLQPKNSVMCLNELQTGLKYITERVENVGNFMCTVEVNNQTFSGYGSSKDQAKQAAAESALMSFVKPPPPKPAAGEHPNPEDDATPWRAIASFAMYKLFTDWRDNKIGAPAGFGFPVSGAVLNPQLKADAGNNIAAHLKRAAVTTTNVSAGATLGAIESASSGQVSVHDRLGLPPVAQAAESNKQVLKPISQAKLDPQKLATSQPVMILHQMCPQISYTSSEKMEGNIKTFTVSADINGQVFTGEGTAVKRAKIQLAKSALKALYDIDNIYTPV